MQLDDHDGNMTQGTLCFDNQSNIGDNLQNGNDTSIEYTNESNLQ